MNHSDRRLVETNACTRRYGIADEKGAEYSGKGSTYKESGADTLANFKRVGERRGISAESALMVYLDKHMDSISTAVREASAYADIAGRVGRGPGAEKVYAAGEGIRGRLDDARNYLDLLECLLVDRGLIEFDFQPEGNHTPEQPDEILAGQQYVHDTDYVLTDAGLLMVHGLDDQVPTDKVLEVLSELGVNKEAMLAAGYVMCYDGVWRPRVMPEGTPVQTPMFAQKGEMLTPAPAVFDPKDPETGELT